MARLIKTTIGALSVLAQLLMGVRALEAGFEPAVNYPVGSFAFSVAVGDFDEDGSQDLAVANWGSGVSILLGTGTGTFHPAVNYGAGSASISVAVGDFDRDGNQDLAVANHGSANVSILLGIGDGTFRPAVKYGVGSHPNSVALGDFDGDGKTDLAVANSHSASVSVLLGHADGTFDAAVNYGVGTNPSSVAVGDFNVDGRPDLAVANGTFGTGNVAILLGSESGIFQAAVNYDAGSFPSSLALGDFDGNGQVDVAVSNLDTASVSILLGTGTGALQPAVSYAADTDPYFVAVGEFNGDGKADLAVASVAGVQILLGSGNGAFSAPTGYAAGSLPQSVAVGDFDRDGKQDLAVANENSHNVSVLLNDSSDTVCTFQPAVPYGVGDYNYSVAVGDFNRDGSQDLAVTTWGSSSVSILLGTGTGTFERAAYYGAPSLAYAIAVGDFNRDGNQDLVVVNIGSGNVSILLGRRDGTFEAAVNYGVGSNPTSVAAGDFNRDGKLDLAVSSGNVWILLGDGHGAFQRVGSYAVGSSPWSVAVGDFDGDGKQDLAVANVGSDNVSILLGDGHGAFEGAGTYSVGWFPFSAAVGDFDADGNQDLAVSNLNSDSVSILLGTGTGTFRPAVSYAANTDPYFVTVGDFNGDGKQDLAVAAVGVSILLGDGRGAFSAPAGYVAERAHSIAVGDFDEDGKQDLAVANYTSSNVSVLLNSCGFVTTTSLGSSANPSLIGQSVTFTANVTAGSGGAVIPTGWVAFRDGSITLGNGALSGGTATFETAALSLGVHAITAVYQGDASHAASTSPVLTQTVQAPTTTSVLSSANPSSFGQSVTFTATVTSSAGTPTGTVTFKDGTTSLGSGTLSDGTASFATAALSYGSHSITAVYGGDVNFAASASVAFIQTISGPRGDFDADGQTDILFRHAESGRNMVWFMDGVTRTAGAFTNPDVLLDTNWQLVGTSDFNGDARTDVLFRHAVSGKNVVWYMDGITRTAGVFMNPAALPATNWRIVGTGDFSSPLDGKPDLLFRHEVSGKNVVWFMDGITRTTGVFTNPDTLADAHWQIAGVGDFSSPRDGKADILWRHTASGKNVVWFMDGITRTLGVFTNPSRLPDTNWTIAAVGDYSSPPDGKSDILWRHQVSGKTFVWFMDGVNRTAGVFTNPAQLPDTNWKIVGPK